MDLKLRGSSALVTGATRGIGRAIAEILAEEGCNVGICARNMAEVKSAVAALEKFGVMAFGKAVDARDGASLNAWVEEAAEVFGGIDCLVANVTGGNLPGIEGWRANFEVDMLGTVQCIDSALPFLERSSSGSVIVMSSTAALEQFLRPSGYNSMKAALLNYAGSLAHELALKGIRVNAVSPGPIMVEGGGAWDKVREHMRELYEATLAQIPLGRMGRPRDIAVQVALLASPISGFITGANIVIDGGFTKRIQY